MKKFSTFAVSIAVALVATLTMSTAVSSAGIVDQPKPLVVKLAGPEAKSKLRVKKKLAVLVSCSKDCSIRAKITLVLPAVSDSGVIKGNLLAGRVGKLRYTLTSSGLNYLKDNYRSSKMKIKVSAKDNQTGKRVTKSRTFRFFR